MAENTQLWGGQRQGYMPPRMPFPGTSQSNMGISSLTREERQEAKRLSEEASFSFEGYQVVRREFISHRFDPAMTIRGNSITFNNSCISKLEDATYIQFLINPTEHKLAIRPCDEGARDAVRWCIVKGDKRKSREITCRPFTTKLYELMGWETIYRYKLQGMKINYQGENLYLFDLSSKEAFLPQSRDPETGKIKRPKPILPREWMETFGMNVDEHTASTQISLMDGFMSQTETAEGIDKSNAGADEETEVTQ
ncbi:MAG: integrase [Clostridia bacterium]|nr:integrase [Clostridia bacterium]